jgi:hypothetical protein
MAVLVAVVSMVILLVSLAVAIRRQRQRAFVLVSNDGFVYRDRHAEWSYTDDQIVGVNVISTPNYRQGVLQSHTNAIEFKVAERTAPIKLQTTTTIDRVDPLAGLVERAIDNYRQRAEMALDAGARLSGAGWSLGLDDLAVEGKHAARVSIGDLVAIDTVDEQHKIWRRGQDEPILNVPVKSENAFLLSVLLGPKVASTNEAREFDASEPGLGRLIFRRATGRLGRGFAWFCIAFSILSIPALIAAVVIEEPTLAGVSCAAIFLAPFALLLAVCLLRNDFRCHQRGVYRRSLLKQRELRFEDVESFKYNMVRQYYNGVYSGTSLELVFFPAPGSGKKKLAYSRMVQNADEALDGLRDHVSRILMPKLAEQLSSERSVQWMPNVRITDEGFYYRPKGFVSRKDEQFLPFSEVSGFNIEEGTFHVWKDGVEKSVIHELTSEPNFYPGFMLLGAMFSAAGENATDDDDTVEAAELA